MAMREIRKANGSIELFYNFEESSRGYKESYASATLCADEEGEIILALNEYDVSSNTTTSEKYSISVDTIIALISRDGVRV